LSSSQRWATTAGSDTSRAIRGNSMSDLHERRGAHKPRPRAGSAHRGSPVPVYLGLGSNVGDRSANLEEAVRRLERVPSARLLALSRVYETEPVGPVPQSSFLNAVARLEVALSPPALLVEVKRIEVEMGRREPNVRWGPREIDVDILLFGDEQISADALAIPHPEMWRRRFVLVPLLEVLSPGRWSEAARRALDSLGPGQVVRVYASPPAPPFVPTFPDSV